MSHFGRRGIPHPCSPFALGQFPIAQTDWSVYPFPMARQTAREKLLDAALKIMLEKGYSSTSVDELCEAAGVSKGSFYHFFKTKEDLGVELLRDYHRRGSEAFAAGPHGQIPDPKERALAFVDHLLNIAAPMWGPGCLIGNFALDLTDAHPALQQEVSDTFRSVSDGMAAILAPLDPDQGPGAGNDLAEDFLVTLEGALVLARAHDDWAYVTRALNRFRQCLN